MSSAIGDEATPRLQTSGTVPLADLIGDQMPIGDEAQAGSNSDEPLPLADLVGGQTRPVHRDWSASSGDGAAPGSHTSDNHLPHAAPIASLIELQRQRGFCIRSQSRCDRSTEAFVARYLGYRADMPEAERTKIWKQVSAFRKKVERDGGQTQAENRNTHATEGEEGQYGTDDHLPHALSACIPIILNSAKARSSWDTLRANVEKQMRKLARTLPVWPWVEGTPGFGDLGLAIIVGETGDMSSYATKERVWKRLGLAVIAGERQQRRRNPEEAAAHGYNPRRRAEIWTINDSFFRHNWRGEKDGIPAHPRSRYGEIYAARKAHTATREWTLAHREHDARRIMCKALLEETWKAWRTATGHPKTMAPAPSAIPPMPESET